jgi:uncharacterized membrane protein (DUF2068 family)
MIADGSNKYSSELHLKQLVCRWKLPASPCLSDLRRRKGLRSGTPEMISASTSKTVVKSVALFEAIKGTVVLLGGFGLLSLLHRNIRLIAAALVGHLHMNPAHGFANSFIEAASRVTDSRLWMIALLGFVYGVFLLIEAYGLWFGKVWAEWVAVLSGGTYLPVEIYELLEKITWVRLSALTINLLVIGFMGGVLVRNRRKRIRAN